MLIRSTSIACVYLLCTNTVFGQGELLDLPIGDPVLAERRIAISLDRITDTAHDEMITPQMLAERILGDRVVLVGEEHTGHEFHAVQLRVLELLHAADVPLSIGLEMIPIDEQAALDAWIAGELDEQRFLESSDWYRIWGYNWNYYRDIFLFARQQAIPMFALRAAEDESQSSDVATVAPTNDHRALIAAFFEADSPVHGGLSPAQLDGLVVAQVKRDAAMAQHAMKALEAHQDRTLVLLAGTGHVLYRLGIVAQLPETQRRAATTILPVPVDEDSTPVRASVADFVWGIPEENYPRYPEPGLITMQADEGLRIIHLEPESPAGIAGLAVGDVLTHFAGTAIDERRDLSAALATVRWGDEIRLSVLRENAREELAIVFRR